MELIHWSLARHVKLWIAHAPGMPGTFSPPPRVSDPDMHHGTCMTHAPWCMPGSLTSGFLWSWWRRKRSRHSRRMRNPWFYVSGKRPMTPKSSYPLWPTFIQVVSYMVRKRWRATAWCGKSKFAISSGWLTNGSLCHPDDITTLS